VLYGAPISFEVRTEGGASRLSGRFPYGAETSLGNGRRERFAARAFRSRIEAGENVFLNRPGFAGGSNFPIGWSHDEQNDEQVFP